MVGLREAQESLAKDIVVERVKLETQAAAEAAAANPATQTDKGTEETVNTVLLMEARMPEAAAVEFKVVAVVQVEQEVEVLEQEDAPRAHPMALVILEVEEEEVLQSVDTALDRAAQAL